MSNCSLFQKLKSGKELEYINNHSKPVFNSKLFLDLDINEGMDEIKAYNSDNNTEDSDNPNELEEINYLSNELIEELDSCDLDESTKKKDNKMKNFNNMNSNKNIIDSLLSLANNGYEFKPKNYKPIHTKNNKNLMNFNKNITNNNINNNNYIQTNSINKNSIPFDNTNNITNIININNFREQKNDWVCSFCKNLNFSFRTKCNRCKAKKEDSEKKKNIFMNIAI